MWFFSLLANLSSDCYLLCYFPHSVQFNNCGGALPSSTARNHFCHNTSGEKNKTKQMNQKISNLISKKSAIYNLRIRSESDKNKTPTCHFIFIRHLSGQLLHGNIIKWTQDDNWSFEISCRNSLAVLKLVQLVTEFGHDCNDIICVWGRKNEPSLSSTLS